MPRLDGHSAEVGGTDAPVFGPDPSASAHGSAADGEHFAGHDALAGIGEDATGFGDGELVERFFIRRFGRYSCHYCGRIQFSGM